MFDGQGRRNSIISGEATSNIAIFFALFPKKLVCQPLISGEAAASPVPAPLHIRRNVDLQDYFFHTKSNNFKKTRKN